MPLYLFRCETCRKDFEEFQASDQLHTADCPCCKTPARRVYSLAGFKLDFDATKFDIGQGQYFNSARERDESAARAGLRRVKVG